MPITKTGLWILVSLLLLLPAGGSLLQANEEKQKTVSSDQNNEYVAGPELTLEFAAWRPSPKTTKGMTFGGSLYLYIRNSGDGAAIVEDAVRINNRGIKELQDKGIVHWHRMRPETLPPGETGELLIRFKTLFAENIDVFSENPDSLGSLDVEIKPKTGRGWKSKIDLSCVLPSIQINFVGFDQNLKKLYLYLQNNEKETTYHLTELFLNGREVTKEASFGERELKDTVIPIELSLRRLRRPRTGGFPAGRFYAATAGAFSASYASGEK